MARQYRSTVEAKTLSSSINTTVTSITLNSTTTLPTAYPYTLVIDPDTVSEEIVTVTAASSGNSFIVTRGQDGTSAVAHNASAVVKHMITARDLQEPHDHMAQTTSVHGIADTALLVSTAGTLNVSSAMIQSNAVTTAKINDAAVTTAKLNDSSVTSAKIVDGTIVNADINSSANIVPSKIFGTAATLGGSETLTNKTLTAPTINSANLNSSINLNSGATFAMDSTSAISAAGYTITPDEIASLDGSGGTNLNSRINTNHNDIVNVNSNVTSLSNSINNFSTADTTVSYSGTGWSWGAGATMTTMYKVIGNIIFMDIQLTAGTSPTAGSGSLVINFPSGAPTADTTITELVAAGVLVDSSPTTYYKLTGAISSSAITMYIDTVTGSNIKASGLTSSTSPITLASGDSIRLSFWYRAN